MTLLILLLVIFMRIFPVGTGWNNRFRPLLLQALSEPITVISFVGNHRLSLITGYQVFRLSDVVSLPRRQDAAKRTARCISRNMNFCTEPAAAAPRSLFFLSAVFFLRHRQRTDVPGLRCCRSSGFPYRFSDTELMQGIPNPFVRPSDKTFINAVPFSVFFRKQPPLRAIRRTASMKRRHAPLQPI